MLDLAAKAAYRATAYVEPNPLVGCVLVRPGDEPVTQRVIGIGHHWVYGGPHAEVEALARCRALGHDPTGATAYVTLEPCNGHGKNPPCVKALVEAGVARVVCAAKDETEGKGGGGAALNAIGIPCEFTRASQRAVDLSEPWRHRMRSPLPWVIAKWAQTPAGSLTAPAGESKWISNPRSRLRVHRLRSMVDAVMVGAATVADDDPLLTVRGVPDRRTPARVVVSRNGNLALDRKIVLTAAQTRTMLLCESIDPDLETRLAAAGVKMIREPGSGEHGWLGRCLVRLRREHGVLSLLVEGGATLLRAMLDESLINETHIHTGGVKVDSVHQPSKAVEPPGPLITDSQRWRQVGLWAVDGDTHRVYRRCD